MVIKVGHRPGRSGSCSGVKGSCTFDVELTRCTQDLTLDVNDSVRNKTLVSVAVWWCCFVLVVLGVGVM